MIRPGLHLESDGAAMVFPNLGASRVSVSMPQLLTNTLLYFAQTSCHFMQMNWFLGKYFALCFGPNSRKARKSSGGISLGQDIRSQDANAFPELLWLPGWQFLG